ITHQHMDHFGLASILARRSGAEVAALSELAPFLASYGHQTDLEDQFAERIMLRHGIPPEIVTALRAVSAGFRAWGEAVEVTRPLGADTDLELRDRTLRVLHRPGHSPSDTVFWDEERRILIAADHLLANISSNPLISRPLDGSSQRSQALVTYIESLRRTREMPAEIVLPGHGDPVVDHVALIDERLAKHERRKEKIYKLIEERPRTGYELAQAIWGNVAVTQAFLTLSEVIGHADLLVNEGRVREAEDGAVIRYETTG
ncbi:MAG TPA: MBL fold metallo-hydrolase, partial [Solirubrobacterales bacterium]